MRVATKEIAPTGKGFTRKIEIMGQLDGSVPSIL